ncbi:MAG: Methionyl-tRNA formyltransferase [Candidatus Magasanikbacteria bacterium GW2011_GWC2_40_17]|uniref:Methionyl-tRNA formyltransferase n=1 Tax=Candidatus Magasanikbacteria bacterium GW2011_GWA2_42_32 TaxID=1619039 RepID=A0A0G1CG45_9BACT|nr:MAG: Methionyl-tRNA formyltransferase [Candidatus Magasanikbacteria bacterium GW2011_GWC2_40_17]KKS57536.1 MAG: Methionyl-tRNA formyltransferase [Candidatus Magasanikbacteria bacterium GW2011_GWA2_42_32]OGH85251.1 MAG: methionyl-tRNA formyltransferase [Candidatus Magasanikbacteria bacterium RIFOXYB2_FULL_38_10]
MYKVVFFGTQEFAKEILEKLISDKNFSIELVITPPDKPIGRKKEIFFSPVKNLALKEKIKVEQPENLKNTALNLNFFDVGVVAQYGFLIPKKILEMPKFGMINVHTSLLPLYRGPSPLQSAILNNEKNTGVTIMKMDEGMDTGPILSQKKISINPDDIYPVLEKKLAQKGSDLLIQTLKDYLQGRVEPQNQIGSQATYTKILQKNDGKIDPQNSCQKIYDKWRAFFSWPGIFLEVNPLKIKLVKVECIEESLTHLSPGYLVEFKKNRLGLICGDKKILEILEIQPENKKIMSASSFISGYKKLLNTL